MISLSDYKEFIDKHTIISFDLFDTLLFRITNEPADIFDIVQLKYNEEHDSKITNFKKKRVEAERKARMHSSLEDVTLNDIYSRLSYPEEYRKSLLEIEKEIEIINCIGNRPMIELAQYASSQNKRVVITTDMYLGMDTICAMLKKIGVPYDDVIISGIEGRTKLKGTLYDVLLDKFKTSPDNIIHFGDNVQSDIHNARKHGIASYLPISYYKQDIKSSNNKKGIKDFIIDNFTAINVSQKNGYNDIMFDFGYSTLGPFVYDFCLWVHNKSREIAIDKLFFVAREGYLLYNIYIEIFPEDKEKTFYIRLNNNIINTSNSLEGKVLLDEYLHQLGLFDGKIALVNNSINGTVQRKLSLLYPDFKDNFFGFQFIKNKKYAKELTGRLYAYITDNIKKSLYSADFGRHCLIFEHLLFEDCGTSIGIEKNSQIIKPICEEQRNEKYNHFFIERIQEGCMEFCKDYNSNIGLNFDFLPLRRYRECLLYPSRDLSLLLGYLYNDDKIDGLLSDFTKKINVFNLIFGKTSKEIIWKEAYCTIKHRKIILYLFLLRIRIMYYIKSPDCIIRDLYYTFFAREKCI